MHNIEEIPLIPQNVFTAMREIPPEVYLFPLHVQTMINRTKEEGWTISFFDDYLMDSFMEKHFSNSSLLWAYRQINPHAKVACADIWRYSILFVMGGLYIDDDSSMDSSFEKVSRFHHAETEKL